MLRRFAIGVLIIGLVGSCASTNGDPATNWEAFISAGNPHATILQVTKPSVVRLADISVEWAVSELEGHRAPLALTVLGNQQPKYDVSPDWVLCGPEVYGLRLIISGRPCADLRFPVMLRRATNTL